MIQRGGRSGTAGASSHSGGASSHCGRRGRGCGGAHRACSWNRKTPQHFGPLEHVATGYAAPAPKVRCHFVDTPKKSVFFMTEI